MNNEKNKKVKLILYWTIRGVCIALIVFAIIGLIRHKDPEVPYSNYVTYILQALILFGLTYVPTILDKAFHIRIPFTINLIYLLFVTASILGGEIFDFYVKFSWWDDVLHTFSGSFIASLGFMTVYFLNEKKNIDVKLSPAFIILFCFCFSMCGCLIWEVVEFTIDGIFGSNMQRFNDSITGEPFIGRKALIDTMSDIIEGLGGALLFCGLSIIDVKLRKQSFIKSSFNIDDVACEFKKIQPKNNPANEETQVLSEANNCNIEDDSLKEESSQNE